jgi:hypothetical protein
MNNLPVPSVTIASIFKQYGQQYLATHTVSSQQRRAMADIVRCHTSECGSHLNVCTGCGTVSLAYNSCRNRHCPDCQNSLKHKWMLCRKEELLPVAYFHLVFTVPHQLNTVFLANNKVCYGLLMTTVWKTIDHFSNNPRWLGAQTGCLALLHTWGQNLSYHPHVHCIVPAGGLVPDGSEWLHTHPKYFAPVREMSAIFKQKLLKALEAERPNFTLNLSDNDWTLLIETLSKIDWVVFAQPSFAQPEHVIDYLGNYTHKIAISNARLIKVENDQVYFNYKDYRDGGQVKTMSLPVMEFMRRFLAHVLPHNFYKIRYFGILANRFKAKNISNARSCLKKEGLVLRLKQTVQEFIALSANLPAGCPCMGVCCECGSTTISMYHYVKYQINNTITVQKLVQSG